MWLVLGLVALAIGFTLGKTSTDDSSLQYGMIFASSVGMSGLDQRPVMTHTIEQEFPVVDGETQFPWGMGDGELGIGDGDLNSTTIPVIPVSDITVLLPEPAQEMPPEPEVTPSPNPHPPTPIPVIDDIANPTPSPKPQATIRKTQTCVGGNCRPQVRYYTQPRFFRWGWYEVFTF